MNERISIIQGNLIRQQGGLAVLLELLREEFAYLQERNPKAVTQNEFSMHELIRQLASERDAMVGLLQGKRLSRFILDPVQEKCPEGLEMLLSPSEDMAHLRAELGALLASIDSAEQACIRQGELNAKLATALLSQNSEMVEFLQKQVTPKNTNTYSKRGGYAKSKPEASILQGRL